MITSNKVIKFLFYLLTAIIILFAIFFYKSVISHFVFALLFVFLFNPFIGIIERLGIKRTYAVILFYLFFFVNVVLIANVFIPTLTKQFKSFLAFFSNTLGQTNLEFSQLPYLAKFESFYDKIQLLFPFFDIDDLKNNLVDYLGNLMQRIPNMLVSYTGNLFKLVTYLISVPIVSFFILKDHVFIKKSLYSLIPNKYFEISIIIIDKIKDTIGTYLRALLLEMLIVSTLCSIILTALNIRYGIIIGIMAGVLNVVPYLGPFTGFVVAGLTVYLADGFTFKLILTLVCMIGANMVDNTMIYPLVMGSKTKIHPSVILLSVLAGGLTFGLIGMLLAVPTIFLTTGVLKLLYKSLKDFEMI
jgi:predicted PurR-regulated permease PerM